MLVLTRREDEAIQIGDGIRIVVVRTQGGQVKLRIEAPEGISIVREELVIDRESDSNRCPRARTNQSTGRLRGS